MSEAVTVFDPQRNFAQIVFDGQVYVFDFNAILREHSSGVEASLYAATTMLSRLTHLKALVVRHHASVKYRLQAEFWNLAKRADAHVHLGLPEGKKATASHCTDYWMKAHPTYQDSRQIRDYIEDATRDLLSAHIPRLRGLAEGNRIAEHQTSGARPPGMPHR